MSTSLEGVFVVSWESTDVHSFRCFCALSWTFPLRGLARATGALPPLPRERTSTCILRPFMSSSLPPLTSFFFLLPFAHAYFRPLPSLHCPLSCDVIDRLLVSPFPSSSFSSSSSLVYPRHSLFPPSRSPHSLFLFLFLSLFFPLPLLSSSFPSSSSSYPIPIFPLPFNPSLSNHPFPFQCLGSNLLSHHTLRHGGNQANEVRVTMPSPSPSPCKQEERAN